MNGSKLPISFEGNPWIFAFALFSTMLATLVAMTQIFSHIKEMICIPDRLNAPINIYRFQLILMYIAVMFAVTPDAIYLWTYNDVSAQATNMILNVDRIFDSLFLLPFLAFTWLQIRCGGVLKFQLIRRPVPVDILPSKGTALVYSICGLLMLVMSILVTMSK